MARCTSSLSDFLARSDPTGSGPAEKTPTAGPIVVRLAVLLSGTGTTLQNLLDRIADGRLAAHIAVVISSRPDAGAVSRAQQAGLPTVVVPRKQFADVDRFNDALHAELQRHEFDLIVLAGFLSPFQLRGRYAGRV